MTEMRLIVPPHTTTMQPVLQWRDAGYSQDGFTISATEWKTVPTVVVGAAEFADAQRNR